MTKNKKENKIKEKANEISVNEFQFFKDYHDIFLKKLTDNDKKKFINCKDDKDKFKFIYQKICNENLKFNFKFQSDKNKDQAMVYKDKGNKLFQTEKYLNALEMYNQALITIDVTEDTAKDISILYANRSAVFYHLENYLVALEDIKVSLNYGYPKNISYKVKERKAKCLLALKQHKSALEAFKEALSSLDDATLPLEKKKKMELDIQIMISMLSKHKHLTNESLNKNKEPGLKKIESSHIKYPDLNSKVGIESNKEVGRYAIAIDDVSVGTNIIAEESYASVLLKSYIKTHCYHCLTSVKMAPYPCKTCARVVFCSIKCQEKGQSTHHEIECQVLPFIWKSGLSVICYISFRIISQKNEQFLKQIKQKLNEPEEPKENLTAQEQRFLQANSNVAHKEQRQPEDYLHVTHVATFLFQLLKATNFFKTQDPDFEDFIGTLLLHQIQYLQFNTHEIADLFIENGKQTSRFIGAGIYPTLALLNHSCEPNIVRYFRGTKVFVNLCKNIKKGEQICENYGPIYSEVVKKERLKTLKSQYWFECNCIACENDWPLFEEMEFSQELRFRCETKECGNVVVIPFDTSEFMIKCEKCDAFINIFKGLKTLQDTESLFRLANNYQQNGEYDKATAKFIQLMNALDEHLVPPYRDYILCQRSLQVCFLQYGQKYRV